MIRVSNTGNTKKIEITENLCKVSEFLVLVPFFYLCVDIISASGFINITISWAYHSVINLQIIQVLYLYITCFPPSYHNLFLFLKAFKALVFHSNTISQMASGPKTVLMCHFFIIKSLHYVNHCTQKGKFQHIPVCS